MSFKTKATLLIVSLMLIWVSVLGVFGIVSTVNLNQLSLLLALSASVIGLVGLSFSVTGILFQ